ncbi:Zinc-type alcohol dehydrogenase-like protein -like protein [Purpureocillium lavendulum]|uniref:Zinc-type alcohol dehydrogenase-like protein -like protein n=1 Tax=Purpureocillium lavendulum TaxID=1247861 RepID=A0AB34FM55_9HYPO|nr:Zinc-type alcohol dehydrogenase-like protein -like protein [Purpureocillium lavendulum]
MAQVTETKQWRVVHTDTRFDGLELGDAPIPKLGERDVLVRIHAGDYPFPLELPIIPGSDGAGEVVDVGEKVTLWKKGDRVVTLMIQGHLYGPFTPAAAQTGLGASIDGTLRKYGVFTEWGLVRAPRNLSYREASTLSCAGVTSWNALYGLKPLKPGQTVLVLGTGGVSIFALQFAKAAGATVIATTSSDSKAAVLKKLGADHVIKYSEDPNWGETAKALTPGGQGVDHVIEVGGAGTLHQSQKAIKFEGVMSIIGAVSNESKPMPSILDSWIHTYTARGVAVGSRAMMEDMVAAIESNDIHPLVDDREFSLEETKDAFHYFSTGSNFGKVVITVL